MYLEEERIKQERAEAAYFALPEAQVKALDGIQDILHSHVELVGQNIALRAQIESVQSALEIATSAVSRWQERGIGFALGCIASLLASVIWWRITKQWPFFG